METRRIARLDRAVSVIGLGTWQLGAEWGTVDPQDARPVLRTAPGEGLTF